MAQIPRKYINNYTNALNKISADAQTKLADALAKVDLTDVGAARDAIIDIMEMHLGPYTDMAATLAAEFYDGLRMREVGTALGALAESGRESVATEKAVRGIMQDVVDGKPPEQVIRKLVSRADYEIKRAAGECVYRNGRRDPLKPKYARVPQGAENCKFCIMLASRGFVYHNAKQAGENGHYHANCDCRIVPGFDGETAVEGYDPSTYYDQYKKMLEGHELDSHYDLLTRNGKTTKRLYETAKYDYNAALGTKSKKDRASAKYATEDGTHNFRKFEDVKQYIYGATSKADMEHRYSQLGKLYGFDSEQMQSASMKNAFKHVEKRYLNGTATQRSMANGQRRSASYVLNEEDIEYVSSIADKIGVPRERLSFNTGRATSFDERTGMVNVRGNIFPDTDSTNNRDNLSVAAALAHEYYGHGAHTGTILRPGDWRDEFRASYRAAIDTPNLSEEDRAMLMIDAYQRASDAGVTLKYTADYNKLVYGY